MNHLRFALAATALAASINASVVEADTVAGAAMSDALASGLAAACWVMAALSFTGVVMAVLMKRHQLARGTLQDVAASAAAHIHTLPTTASGSPR